MIGGAENTGGPLVMGLQYSAPTSISGATHANVAGYYESPTVVKLDQVEDVSGTSGYEDSLLIYTGLVQIAAEGNDLSYTPGADSNKKYTLTWLNGENAQSNESLAVSYVTINIDWQ